MSGRMVIADFGAGNLLSVVRAFTHLGAEIVVTTDAAEIRDAQRLVVPGVGAFADCMRRLTERGLSASVKDFAASGRPLLGICVGMQMLFESSEEFGNHAGLGLIPGAVRRIPEQAADGSRHKVPHIGWNRLRALGRDWQGTILDGVAPGAFVYYVHSFSGYPAAPADRLADSDYGGWPIAGVVQRGNVSGCQFHPEKSGDVGLKILRNFLSL